MEYLISQREYDSLIGAAQRVSLRTRESDKISRGDSGLAKRENPNAAAFRSALRLYVATDGGLKAADALLARLAARQNVTAPTRKPIVASRTKLALSLSSLLFFHRVLYRIFTRLRLQLLHDKVKDIRQRYPRIFAALTSRLTPAIGASLSGLALGLNPADQLRLTIAIFVASSALEIGYNALESAGYMKKKPWWFGSWLLFPLTQGQLFHAFVFDRDCVPPGYSNFLTSYTPEYIQRRPEGLPMKVTWPDRDQIVDSLAEIATLRWPTFVPAMLHPNNPNTLPRTIDTVISPITSRADPAHLHLSCALIHPNETSCFVAYLRQNLLAFPQLARMFAIYYGALSLLGYKHLIKSPIQFLNVLSKQILKSTLAISGAFGTSWGTICLFAAILPKTFLPKSRFFLGGLLGGMWHFFDQGLAAHANMMFVARMSVDSLWKVGVKRRWWKGIQGGDVLLFMASLVLMNASYDWRGDDVQPTALLKLLRGEIELGLQSNVESTDITDKEE